MHLPIFYNYIILCFYFILFILNNNLYVMYIKNIMEAKYHYPKILIYKYVHYISFMQF